MTIKWTVESMDRDISQDGKADVITIIHWRASETDSDGHTGTEYNSTNVTLGSQSFIAYKDIKESDAIQWAKDAMGSDEVKNIEDRIANQIAEAKTPTTASGVSW